MCLHTALHWTPPQSALGLEPCNEIKAHCVHSKRANRGHMAIKATGYTNLVHYKTADAHDVAFSSASNDPICCLSAMGCQKETNTRVNVVMSKRFKYRNSEMVICNPTQRLIMILELL